jgi:ribosomal protein S18 acetylase RimI-like enzyme
MVSITKAHIDDVPVLSRIGGLTLIQSHGTSAPAHVMQAYVDEKFSVQWLTQEVSNPANIFHLINYNNEPVGYSKIVFDIPIAPVPQANITKMERLYLLREFYSAKLGKELMNFNINLAKQHGQQGMWLYVWKENERAIRFYERTGFKIVGDGYFRLSDDHANPNWQMFLNI